MKLVLTLLVRDEDDVIEANLRHHFAQGVDFAIVTDNRSEDATRVILESFERAGKVRIIDELEDNYDQARWVTRMARLASTDHGADWVINSDADEFWWPKRGDLKSVFERVPAEFGGIAVPRLNFVPVANEERPFYERMVLRETESINVHGHALPPKVSHRGRPDVWVGQGNHDVQATGLELLPGPSPMVILHFPMRTYAQFENKIVKGGSAYERNTSVEADVGAAWRLHYERYRRGTLRSWYDEQVLSPQAVDRRIGEGTLMLDRRLLHELSNNPTCTDNDGPVIRSVPAQPISLRPPNVSPPVRPRPSTTRLVASRVRRALRMRAKRNS